MVRQKRPMIHCIPETSEKGFYQENVRPFPELSERALGGDPRAASTSGGFQDRLLSNLFFVVFEALQKHSRNLITTVFSICWEPFWKRSRIPP